MITETEPQTVKVVKYREVPILFGRDDYVDGGDAVKIRTCARAKGHVLALQKDGIVCMNCPARWRNEGF